MSNNFNNIAGYETEKQELARSLGLSARAESVISKSNFYLHSDKYYL